MKKLITICLLFLAGSVSAQHFHWVRTGIYATTSPTIAGGNNLLATCSGVLPASGRVSAPFMLVVQDTSGNTMWSKSIFCRPGLTQNNHTPVVAVDNSQNIIVAGNFRDSVYIGSRIYKAPASNGTMFFVAKFNTAGTMQWARNSTFTASQNVSSISTATDAVGNVYVSGNFSGTLAFGTSSIVSTGGIDAFVVKYDPNGNFIWAQKTGTPESDNSVIANVTPSGMVYLIAGSPVASMGTSTKQLLAKFDANGTLVFNKIIIPNGNSNITLALDNAENLYIAGNYTGSLDFTSTFSLTSVINSKTFLAKYTPGGNFKWAKDIITGNNYTSSIPALYYSADNTLALAGSFNGMGLFGTTQLSSLPSGQRNSFIVKTDTAGTMLWNKIVPGITGETIMSDITGNGRGTYYTAGLINGGANFSGSFVNSLTSQMFNAKLKAVSGNVVTGSILNLVTGNIFLDSNLNGIRDANETGVSGLFTGTSTNSTYNITNADGNYYLFLPPGSATIVPAPKKYHQYIPAVQTVSFTGSNQTTTGKDFALQLIPNQTDVRVTVTNFTAARPGFGFTYSLTIQNMGTNILSDTLTLNHDPLLNFVTSNQATAATSNGKIKWHYVNLKPLESRNIVATFQIPATAPLGSPLELSASLKPITTDLFQQDNFDTTRLVITGSYDPNDKQADKPFISPSAALNGELLDYTIRFQNTGTDTAFTIIVADKISAKLNLADYEIVAASHPYQLSLRENNVLEWRFDNILLPDSNRNEPLSHGFVRFRIKNKPGLVLGDSITNQAAIYFDFNAPVLTNYAVTKVVDPLGIKIPKAALPTFKLYPNPAKNYVMVAADLKRNLAAKVTLVNMLGQVISEVTLPANSQIHYQMPLKELPKGVYIVQLQTEAGRQTQRLVIQ